MPCNPTLKRSPALPLIPIINIRWYLCHFLNSCSCYWTMVSLLNHTKRKTELLHQPSVGDNHVSDLSVIHQWSNEWLSTDQLQDYWPTDYSAWLPILEQNSTNIATDMLNDMSAEKFADSSVDTPCKTHHSGWWYLEMQRKGNKHHCHLWLKWSPLN